MTLDAGGTNFVFSALRDAEEVVAPVTLPSQGDDLDACLGGIVDGFSRVKTELSEPPDAISFAFPGPADFPAGIIGDLTNLPAFRGGVALGPMLEDRFGVPVFINNDGDLFAFGEAIAGLLPWINRRLKEHGSNKEFRNLFGFTLGTGFGGGIVSNGQLLIGDNSGATEVWALRHRHDSRLAVEEGASIRGVRHAYATASGIDPRSAPEPKTIYEIAIGAEKGDRPAAIRAYEILGQIVGDAVASVTTLVDGLVVMGGGLAGAAELFLPTMVQEMNGELASLEGGNLPRMYCRAFNLEDDSQLNEFIAGDPRCIEVPGSGRAIEYDAARRVGVGLSRLGTSRAVAVGAYYFAVDAMATSG